MKPLQPRPIPTHTDLIARLNRRAHKLRDDIAANTQRIHEAFRFAAGTAVIGVAGLAFHVYQTREAPPPPAPENVQMWTALASTTGGKIAQGGFLLGLVGLAGAGILGALGRKNIRFLAQTEDRCDALRAELRAVRADNCHRPYGPT